jgi:signal transduction histidine kinase
MEHFLLALAIVCSIAGLTSVAVLLARERRVTARLQRKHAALADGLRRRDEELAHLAMTRLPELMESLFNPAVVVSGPLHDPCLLGPAHEHGTKELMDLFAGSVERVQARADKAAQATLRSAMRGVQSLAAEQQLAISTMQERHDDPDVLADLLRLDHMNAQLGRRAQATAVLCGSWPGQQRSASSLTDVVRGATSRIRDYLRVQVHSPVNAALVSRVVEPVVLSLAELLDNATRHSHPDSTVEVNVQNAHNGVSIMIDDAGVAMDADEVRRATEVLSGLGSVDIHRLGDPPQIGFAVTGLLAARYGFSVSVDTRSPYGGVRAVVFLPNSLITTVPADEDRSAPPAAESGTKTATGVRVARDTADHGGGRGSTQGGLPKRHRTEATKALPAAPAGPRRPARPARETAAGLGAWQRGSRSGREASPANGTADAGAGTASSGRVAAPSDGEGEDRRP